MVRHVYLRPPAFTRVVLHRTVERRKAEERKATKEAEQTREAEETEETELCGYFNKSTSAYVTC